MHKWCYWISRKDDIIEILMKVSSNELSSVIHTWATYNSLITERKDKTIFQQLPILNGSLTCWEKLYWAMTDSEKLDKDLLNGRKTVLSFDLQLYVNPIHLQVKQDICNNCFSKWQATCCIYLVKCSRQAYWWKQVRPSIWGSK